MFKPPPNDIEFDDLYSCVDSFPSIDPPEVFGMHPNAELEHLKHSSKQIIDSLILMRPRTAVAAG